MKKLLTTKEAAKFLSVSCAFLERDRWAGARIPFIKIGSRTVRYDEAALVEYTKQHTSTSTASGSSHA